MLAADPAALIVTAADDDGPSGCLISFASPCSIDPPRYLVMLSVANHTFDVASRTDALAVHVLGREDMDLAARFGELTGDCVDKFADLAWSPGPRGAPIIEGGQAWMVGSIEQRIDLGDHTGFVIAPVASGVRAQGPPLRFLDIRKLEPGHPA